MKNSLPKPESATNHAKWKKDLLDNFAQWLDDIDKIPESTTPLVQEPDLGTLLREFTALRQEVKIQARTAGKLAPIVTQVSEDLTKNRQSIDALETVVREKLPQIRKEVKRQSIENFFEILAAIKRTANSMEQVKLPILITPSSRKRALKDLIVPLGLLDGKVNDLMRQIKLEEVAKTGECFNAVHMQVMHTSQTDAPDNTVTEVLHQGYLLDGELIRTAEVVVEQSK
ncbi:MAG: nucleotide exchange factor GrpE [Mariprofundaceae bacterium]|nr:nucleotide exchange factor GrpE [Mariprofundaceae bacterium]